MVYALLDWGFSEQLDDLGGSSVLDATCMYLLGVVVLPACCLDLLLPAGQCLRILHGNLRRQYAVSFYFYFDLGKAYCCSTVAAFHSFYPDSGLTLT